MTDAPQSNTPDGTAAAPTPVLGMAEQRQLRQVQNSTNRLLWAILGVLVLLVGAVIFMLPKYMSERAATNAAAASATPAAPVAAPAAPTGAAATPYEEAQRMKQREQAQQTLQSLLALQTALEQKDVKRWAGAPFDDAVATAKKGDEVYANGHYEDANRLYETATRAMQKLQDGEQGQYASLMQQGQAAFQAGNADEAEKAFSLAAALNSGSSEAATMAARSRVLKDVLALLRDARALEANNLEAARDKYQQALALDKANADAPKAIARINTAIVDRNFAAAMSRGFAALQAGQADKAQEAFHQADTIKPGTNDVKAALQQAQDQQSTSAINVHIANAKQKEAAENWQEALTAWNAALAIDPNLVVAQEGQKRTNGRNNLDQFLAGVIKEPLRLADQGVFAQTTQVMGDAARIQNPGGKLQGQLTAVRKLLEQIRVPATVSLQSDGRTSVTLYKVGDLGQFSSKTVNLTPGTYTAVGSRQGYRDVRKEFTVAIDGQAPVVTVSCSEAI
ncbi:MAG TPA: hypothetical protein VMH83_07170 [Candidatus Acidoferrum sp.]|nr:hypothetical protein [Candidatus Acidoferrum sp.]